MKNEIDKNFYCSGDSFRLDGKCEDTVCSPSQLCLKICRNYHRKWPTPEQFEEEYGEEYPDDGAVWIILRDCTNPLAGWSEWTLMTYEDAIYSTPNWERIIVCACTPFGKPDDNWRPA